MVDCGCIEVDYIKVLKPAPLLHIDTPMKQLQKDILATMGPT